ncbi:MAG: TetR/AcrR family transcriptional regulator [Proteobacteria bacterium]|nr:TetR/AcrR family transcriptional regulator [Pseudomonadota bacterium]
MASQKRSGARKDQILKAAEKVFAEKGFHEATISEVAREAGLSDATIYEYFSTKEELLFSIPVETTEKGMETLNFHLNYIRGASNKVRSIVYHYLSFYQNHPEYASVVMLILKQNRKFLDTEAYRIIREGFRVITRVVEEGVASREFRSDANPFLVRSVLLGTIEHLVIRRLLLGQPEDLMSLVDPLTDMIIQGIQKDEGPKGWHLRLVLDRDEGEPTGEVSD